MSQVSARVSPAKRGSGTATTQRSRRLVWGVKVGGTLVACTWIVLRVDFEVVGKVLAGLGAHALVAIAALSLLSVLVSAWRYKRVLHYLGSEQPFLRLLVDCLVASSYNLLLPSAVGGDVVKAVRLAPRVAESALAYAAVLFDRVLGLAALGSFAAVGLLAASTTHFASAAPVPPLALAVVALLLPAPWLLGRLVRSAHVRRASFAKPLARLGEFLEAPLLEPRALVETLAWSVVFQAVSLSILACSGLVADDARLAIYFGVPSALVVASLPISVGGHGVRESMFVVALAWFAVDSTTAFALSMVWLGSSVFVGLLGLVVALGDMAWQRDGA